MRRIVIIDEVPPAQFSTRNDCLCRMFRAWGIAAEVVDPSRLAASAEESALPAERSTWFTIGIAIFTWKATK